MAERNQDRPGAEEKSAAEIERDIDRTRAEIDDTLDRIFNRLTPGDLFEQTIDYLRSSHGFARFGGVVRDNPVPAVLAAFGIGWLIIASLRTRPEEGVPVRTPLLPSDYQDRTALSAREQGEESVTGSGELEPSIAPEREERSFASTTSQTLDAESEPTGTPATDRSS